MPVHGMQQHKSFMQLALPVLQLLSITSVIKTEHISVNLRWCEQPASDCMWTPSACQLPGVQAPAQLGTASCHEWEQPQWCDIEHHAFRPTDSSATPERRALIQNPVVGYATEEAKWANPSLSSKNLIPLFELRQLLSFGTWLLFPRLLHTTAGPTALQQLVQYLEKPAVLLQSNPGFCTSLIFLCGFSHIPSHKHSWAPLPS